MGDGGKSCPKFLANANYYSPSVIALVFKEAFIGGPRVSVITVATSSPYALEA